MTHARLSQDICGLSSPFAKEVFPTARQTLLGGGIEGHASGLGKPVLSLAKRLIMNGIETHMQTKIFSRHGKIVLPIKVR
jgi:hypothetical protein